MGGCYQLMLLICEKRNLILQESHDGFLLIRTLIDFYLNDSCMKALQPDIQDCVGYHWLWSIAEVVNILGIFIMRYDKLKRRISQYISST